MVEAAVARMEQAFDTARAENRALLLPYLTAGLPSPEASIEMFVAMAEAGADGFEIGIPYSDPLMDGPTIQEAGQQALAAGTSFSVALDVVEQVVARTGLPVFVMTYVNPVLARGAEAYAAAVADAGASGLIIADLPVDEAEHFEAATSRAGLGMGFQPSACSTARRIARFEFPPIQIGGLGRCTGRGRATVSTAEKWRPSMVTGSPLHTAFMATMASSVTSLRRAKSPPTAANSASR